MCILIVILMIITGVIMFISAVNQNSVATRPGHMIKTKVTVFIQKTFFILL